MGWSLWNKSVLPIGVDLGRAGVKMAQLRQSGSDLKMLAAARKGYGRPWPVDDLAAQKQELVKAVRAALEVGAFSGRECVCCPSASDLLLRAVRLPRMSDEELQKAVIWEAAERFGVPVDDLQVDWVRAGEIQVGEETRDEVILIAATRSVLAARLDALVEAGLTPQAVDAPFLAAARALTRSLRRQSDTNTVRMTVDVGASGSTVSITRGQDLAFLKTVKVGGDDFTRAVAEKLSLDDAAARQLRRERIAAHAPGETETEFIDRVDRAAYEAVRPLIHELSEETALCLRYYSVTFRGGRPEFLGLLGGDAQEPHLAKIVAEQLKIESEVCAPLEGIDLSQAQLGADRRTSPLCEWAVATGLSLHGGKASMSARRDAPATSCPMSAAPPRPPSAASAGRGANRKRSAA